MGATLGAEIASVRNEASIVAAAGASAVAAMQAAMAQQTASMNAAMENQEAASSTALSRAMTALDSTLALQRTQAQSTATAQANGVTAAITSLNSTYVDLEKSMDRCACLYVQHQLLQHQLSTPLHVMPL